MNSKEFLESKNIKDHVLNREDLAEHWVTMSELLNEFKELSQNDVSDMVMLHLKDNDGIGCFVGVYESIDKFIELIKNNYPLDTFKVEDKNGKLLIERYFRGDELSSRHNYSYKTLKFNSNFVYFK